jgi:5'-nucleotidase
VIGNAKMRLLCVILLTFFEALLAQQLFPLSIIHLNDMHARFEEINVESNTCKDPSTCIGGYARVVSMVKELKGSRPNPIYMNAADNFQGTLWYNIFRWNVTQHFLNLLPADAMVSFITFQVHDLLTFYICKQII